MKLLKEVTSNINKNLYGTPPETVNIYIIDNTTEKKQVNFFKTKTVPANDPHILVRITKRNSNYEYVAFKFSPEKWNEIEKESRIKTVDLGIRYGEKHFYLYTGKDKIKGCYCSVPNNDPHILVEITDKKRPLGYLKFPIDKWHNIEIASLKMPVAIGTSVGKDLGEKYYIFLYKSIFYASEISMTGQEVLTVLENTTETKKEKLNKEL